MASTVSRFENVILNMRQRTREEYENGTTNGFQN